METQSQPLISLHNVKKIFFTDEVETHALADVNIEIREGEYVSVAGPSGCGKSTLLSIIGLLDSPTEGSYVLNGEPVERLSANERAELRNTQVGFIFQSFNLIGDMDVYRNIELPLMYRGLPKGERQQRVEEALEQVGMTHRARHMPSKLSGGQQQRVAVARALAGRPAILLADEPTGNLDSQNGESVMHLLEDLHAAGTTICLITHDPRYAAFADRRLNMFDGRVVEQQLNADAPAQRAARAAEAVKEVA
jgi:putative ABC transport system ATP-binding protein